MTAEVSQIPPTIPTVGHRLHLKKEEPAKRKNEMLDNNNQGDEYDISRILEKEAEVTTKCKKLNWKCECHILKEGIKCYHWKVRMKSPTSLFYF